MLVALGILSYFIVGSVVMGYSAALRGEASEPWENPQPFFNGLLWPLTVPSFLMSGSSDIAIRIGIAIGLRQIEARNRSNLKSKELQEAKLLAEKEIQVAMKELE